MRKSAALGVILTGMALMGGAIGCATYVPSVEQELSSDTYIAREAINRLAADSLAGRYAFNVTVRDGIATVEGAVPDEAFRLRVIGIVQGTPGVRQVVDGLYRM